MSILFHNWFKCSFLLSPVPLIHLRNNCQIMKINSHNSHRRRWAASRKWGFKQTESNMLFHVNSPFPRYLFAAFPVTGAEPRLHFHSQGARRTPRNNETMNLGCEQWPRSSSTRQRPGADICLKSLLGEENHWRTLPGRLWEAAPQRSRVPQSCVTEAVGRQAYFWGHKLQTL